MYTLVIIDMQDNFAAAKYKSVQYGCISEIEQAIKRNAPIVFVEYRYSGKTVESLKQLIAAVKYENVHTVTKTTNNGASAINKLLQRKKLPKNHLRVCGVNTDCCVLETIEGFNSMYRNRNFLIEVVLNACGSEHSHEEGVDELSTLSEKVVCI